MSELITVEVDKAAFLAEVRELLEGTLLWNQISGKIVVDWKQPGESFKTLGSLVSNIIAAVEVVKCRIVAHADPDGSKGMKFDGQTALEAAVFMLDEAITFRGALGVIIEMIDRPILVFAIETAFAARNGANWLAVAKALLGLV